MNGGGGSSCKKLTCGRATGPIKTILIGVMIADTVLFQAIGESLPVIRTESGDRGNPRGPVDPKSEVVMDRKANPETMKRTTNFLPEISMPHRLPHDSNPIPEQQKTRLDKPCFSELRE